MPIRCKSLQTFQQCRDNHEDSPDQERPGPSETEKERDSEIANDVVELPTEVRAGRLFFRPEGSDHKQDHDGHATSFCASTNTMFYIGARAAWSNSPRRDADTERPDTPLQTAIYLHLA